MLCRGLYELLIPVVYIGGCFYVIPFMTDCRNAYYQACTCQIMQIRLSMVSAAIISLFLFSGGCTSTTPTSPQSNAQLQTLVSPTPALAPAGSFTIRAESLNPGSVLPDTFTCKGAGESVSYTHLTLPT